MAPVICLLLGNLLCERLSLDMATHFNKEVLFFAGTHNRSPLVQANTDDLDGGVDEAVHANHVVDQRLVGTLLALALLPLALPLRIPRKPLSDIHDGIIHPPVQVGGE